MFGRVLSIILLLSFWIVGSNKVGSIILPPPLDVLIVVKEEILTLEGVLEVYHTMSRFLFSYTISVVSGIAVGIAVFKYDKLKKIIWPIVTSLQATPIISWILLALLWFSSAVIPFFIVWVFILPIISINVCEGLANTDKKLIEMATVYEISSKDTWLKIYLPSLLPYLRAGMKISANSSLKVLVTAEIIGKLPEGMGNSMNNAWLNIDTASLLAWTILLIILTSIVEKLITIGMGRVFRRYL